MMKRRQFVSLMAGISLAMAFALTSCDDVLAETRKGLLAVAVADPMFEDFAEVVAQMEIDAEAGIPSATYTLNGGGVDDHYLDNLTLNGVNTSPPTVTINGGIGGWVVTGNGNSITVGSGVTLTLTNITFTKIPFTVATGGKLVLDSGAVVNGNDDDTGVIVDGGTLEMNDGSSITGNGDSDFGQGGVRMVGTGSRFTMNGGEISFNASKLGNYEEDGGGVGIHGASAVFTMNGGSIHDNTAICLGGGILVGMHAGNSRLRLTGGEIYNNHGGYDGGGVWIYENLNVTFDMSGGKIRNNNVTYNCGGVLLHGGGNIFNMAGGEITDNSAGWDGGGVYIDSGSTFNMTGGDITRNSAGYYGGGLYLAGNLTGDPSIGSKDSSKGSIYGNTPNDLYVP